MGLVILPSLFMIVLSLRLDLSGVFDTILRTEYVDIARRLGELE